MPRRWARDLQTDSRRRGPNISATLGVVSGIQNKRTRRRASPQLPSGLRNRLAPETGSKCIYLVYLVENRRGPPDAPLTAVKGSTTPPGVAERAFAGPMLSHTAS